MKKRKVDVVLNFQFAISPCLLYFDDECTEHEHRFHYAEDYFDKDEKIKELISNIYCAINEVAIIFYEASYRVNEIKAKNNAKYIVDLVASLKKELFKYDDYEFKINDYITCDYKKYLDK